MALEFVLKSPDASQVCTIRIVREFDPRTSTRAEVMAASGEPADASPPDPGLGPGPGDEPTANRQTTRSTTTDGANGGPQ